MVYSVDELINKYGSKPLQQQEQKDTYTVDDLINMYGSKPVETKTNTKKNALLASLDKATAQPLISNQQHQAQVDESFRVAQSPGMVDKIENSQAWRTIIGDPEEGFGLSDMLDAVIMANPAGGVVEAGAKAIVAPAINAVGKSLKPAAELFSKLPEPVQKAVKIGTAATGYEAVKGATDPDYVNPISGKQTLPSQAGASARAGTGDVLENFGQISKWKGNEKLGDNLINAGKAVAEGYEVNRVPFTWKSLLDPDWYANNVASSLPSTVTLIPLAYAGYKGAGKAAGKLGAGPMLKTIIASLGGATLSRPLESAMEAGNTYDEVMAKTGDENQANVAADRVFNDNLKLAGLDAAQLAAAFMPTPIKAAGRVAKGAMIAGKLGTEAGTEALEEGYQQAVQQRASGADNRNIVQQMLHPDTAMKESMAIGGLLGAGLGGAGSINEILSSSSANQQNTSPYSIDYMGQELADLPTRIMEHVAANLPPEMKTQVGQDIENSVSQGMDLDTATLKAYDNLSETEEGKQIIANSSQVVAQDKMKLFFGGNLNQLMEAYGQKKQNRINAASQIQPQAEQGIENQEIQPSNEGNITPENLTALQSELEAVNQQENVAPEPQTVLPQGIVPEQNIVPAQEVLPEPQSTNIQEPKTIEKPMVEPKTEAPTEQVEQAKPAPGINVGDTVYSKRTGKPLQVTAILSDTHIQIKNTQGNRLPFKIADVEANQTTQVESSKSLPAASKQETKKETTAAPTSKPQPDNTKTVSSLREQAARMQKTIDEKKNPAIGNQNPTARRANIAAGMYQEGERLEEIQGKLNAVANAIESGSAPEVLSKIKKKTHIETLRTLLASARSRRVRSESGNYNGNKYSLDDPDNIKYAYLQGHVHPQNLKSLLEAVKGKPGTKDAATRVSRIINSEGRLGSEQDIKAIETLLSKMPDRDYTKKAIKDNISYFKRTLELADNTDQLQELLRAYVALGETKPTEKTAERKIKEMERELIGAKIPGYFPTPKPVVEKMLEQADIEPGMKILEPSAGKGSIADAVRESEPKADIDVIEINPTLRNILQEKGYNLIGSDFMELQEGQYDRIIMNPPFEKGQDIEHVRHAYELLKPGGKVVAIMSEGPFFRNDKKASEFRDWLDELDGTSEKLPEKSFTGKDSDRQTGVAARMVVIDKPEAMAKSKESPIDAAKLISDMEKDLASSMNWIIANKETPEGYIGDYLNTLTVKLDSPYSDVSDEVLTRILLPAARKIITKAEVKQKPEPVAITGKTVTAKTERGTSIETQYAVVDADDLVASHTTGLKENKDYPQELQPRDRSRVASEAQITRILNNLEPEFLGASPKASEGAPIVGSDMVVESGNGRIIALKRGYENSHKNIEQYRQWMTDNADNFGIDVDKLADIKNPILVRVRKSDVNRIDFVKESNEQSVAAMSATEQAKADAEKLAPEMMAIFSPTDDGNILNKGNWFFIREFMDKVVGANEQGRYATSDGSMSQEGVNRIRNAVFAKAYGNSDVLEKLAESTDNNVKNITNAMLIAAPKMAVVKSGMETSEFYPLDITAEIAAATNKLSQLREQGTKVEHYLEEENQDNMFGEHELDPLTKDILEVFNKHKGSAKAIATILIDYTDGVVAAGNPNQGDLWGDTPTPTKADLLRTVLERMEEGGNGQASLFEDKRFDGKETEKTDGSAGQKEAGRKNSGIKFKAAKREVGKNGIPKLNPGDLEWNYFDQRFPAVFEEEPDLAVMGARKIIVDGITDYKSWAESMFDDYGYSTNFGERTQILWHKANGLAGIFRKELAELYARFNRRGGDYGEDEYGRKISGGSREDLRSGRMGTGAGAVSDTAGKYKAIDADSAAFKKWFGNSKVVDENGKPKPIGGVYVKHNKNLPTDIAKDYPNFSILYEYGHELGRKSEEYSDLKDYLDYYNLPERVQNVIDNGSDFDKVAVMPALRAGFRDGQFFRGGVDKKYDAIDFVIGERIGKVPQSGASRNFRENHTENGVSILGYYDEGKFIAEGNKTYELFNSGEKHYVFGIKPYLESGADGEPLLLYPIDLGKISNQIKPVNDFPDGGHPNSKPKTSSPSTEQNNQTETSQQGGFLVRSGIPGVSLHMADGYTRLWLDGKGSFGYFDTRTEAMEFAKKHRNTFAKYEWESNRDEETPDNIMLLSEAIDKDYTAYERSKSKQTSINTILDNLDRYRREDLESLAEQYGNGSWDGYEGLSDTELLDALRESLEEQKSETTPLEAQSAKSGYYVRPPKDKSQFKAQGGNQNAVTTNEFWRESNLRTGSTKGTAGQRLTDEEQRQHLRILQSVHGGITKGFNPRSFRYNPEALKDPRFESALAQCDTMGIKLIPFSYHNRKKASGIDGLITPQAMYINVDGAYSPDAVAWHETGHKMKKLSPGYGDLESLVENRILDMKALVKYYRKNYGDAYTPDDVLEEFISDMFAQAFSKEDAFFTPEDLHEHLNGFIEEVLEQVEQTVKAFNGEATEQGEGTAAKYAAEINQAISSANTSLNQIAATFKSNYFKPGRLNIDIGGGKYDKGTQYLKDTYETENLVYDPYNRGAEYNLSVLKRLMLGERGDTATANNVLNVIAEPEVRLNVIKQVAKAIKPEGQAYFLIYEGSGSGKGQETIKGWQNNLKAAGYIKEIEQHFGNVGRKGNLIIASEPKNIEGPAIWLDNVKFKYSEPESVNIRPITKEQRRKLQERRAKLKLVGMENLQAEIDRDINAATPKKTPTVGMQVNMVDKSPTPAKNKPNGKQYAFDNEDAEERWQASKGIANVPTKEKLRNILETLKNKTTREFEHLPRTARWAEARYSLLQLQKQKGVAMDRTLRGQQWVVLDMDSSDYDLFSRKVILDDLYSDKDFYTDGGNQLPFGFESIDELEEALAKIDSFLEKNEVVRAAVEKRQRLWAEIKDEYLEAMDGIGYDATEKLSRENYYHHQVLEYANTEHKFGTGQRLKSPTNRGFLKKREGSSLDYNTEYMQAEVVVMGTMLNDIEIARTIKKLDDNYNIAEQVKAEAKKQNQDNFNAIVEKENAQIQNRIQKAINEQDWALLGKMGLTAEKVNSKKFDINKISGPTEVTMKRFNQNMGMAFADLTKLAKNGDLWTGENSEWDDVVGNLSIGKQSEIGEEGSATVNDLYRYLSILAQRGEDGSREAAMILKNTSKKREFIKETLGKKYKTWEDVIPDGYTAWQPREGTAFYFTNSISEKLATQLFEKELESIGLTTDDITKVLARGQKYKQFVIPEELAETLDNIKSEYNDNVWMQALKYWKVYQLVSPVRVFKYNFRNLTGDADAAFAGNPKVFSKAPQAWQELYQVFAGDKTLTPEMKEWFKRGGMQTLLQAQENININELKIFKNIVDAKSKGDKAKEIPLTAWKQYWKTARLGTDFREALLRYAAYLQYLEEMQGSRAGLPKEYGASIPEEIQALSDIRDRAFVLSNQLLGAYDQVSVAGQWIRQNIIPFWSWMEVNPKRYVQLFKNAAHGDNSAAAVGRAMGAKGAVASIRVGKFAIKAIGFSTLLFLYNMLFFRDEEEELPNDVRRYPHIILGRKDDGTVRYFNRLGAFNDFLEWFGVDESPYDVVDFLNGKRTLKEIATDNIKKPVNKITNGLTPYIKLPMEMLTGLKFYPNVFAPTHIRDRWEHLAREAGLAGTYKSVMDRPKRQGDEGLGIEKLLWYESDPREAAYYDIMDQKYRYLRRIGKSPGGYSEPTQKSNALYYYKMAIKYKDREAANRYLLEYAVNGGTEQGLNQSLSYLDPLRGLGGEKKSFIDSLADEDLVKLKIAQEFYEETMAEQQEQMADYQKSKQK